MTPLLHAVLLTTATISALFFAGVILARSPSSASARMHAVYGATVAGWFACTALIAVSSNVDDVQRLSRIMLIAIGILPAVAYHLNVATAGLAQQRTRAIRGHYVVSGALVAFGLLWPPLLTEPHLYAWGYYPGWTAWGLVPLAVLLVVILEILATFRGVARRYEKTSPNGRKARTLLVGNFITLLALVDGLAAFGFAVYPFGFAVLTILNIATAIGAIRYRLLEVTPAIAAERILATVYDGFLVIDDDGMVRLANESAARTLGGTVSEVVDHPIGSLTLPLELRDVLQVAPDGPPSREEVRFLDDGGRERYVVLAGTSLPDEWGGPYARVWVLHDDTERRAMEAANLQLEGAVRQVQKLETIGVMAGGIAHDFNNILTVIGASASLAAMRLAAGEDPADDLRAIRNATDRAAELTRQMLTYAGRGTSVRDAVDVSDSARKIVELLSAAISKKATLELDLADGLPLVMGDTGQLRQVLLNLITNASEAIGDRQGSVSVRTGRLAPDAPIRDLRGDGERIVGPAVFIEVADSGPGMDPATSVRIFDPFFTTKFTGRGLGLATVMGIVKGHDGVITVDSRPGHGTRFVVALPALADGASIAPPVATPTPRWIGSGTVLVADDEDGVRHVAREFLAHAGFDVLEAADGAAAVEQVRRSGGAVDVVLLDVTMPRMDGLEAFVEIRALAPGVPVVFMSGYSEVPGTITAVTEGTSFLEKPFSFESLGAKIGEAMATPGPAADPPGATIGDPSPGPSPPESG